MVRVKIIQMPVKPMDALEKAIAKDVNAGWVISGFTVSGNHAWVLFTNSN